MDFIVVFIYNYNMAKFQRKTKDERRQEIMAAAKKVFLKKGYRYATMEDIISETSLSKGGVYQYYKSTKSIMFDIMSDGNYFRYSRTEEIIKQYADTNDICEIITQAMLLKLYEKLPEKKLYVMFLSEIMYDKETEELFYKLEKEAHALISKNFIPLFENKNIFPKPLSEETKRTLSENLIPKLYSRIFNGILIVYELFNDRNIFEQNKNEVHDMIYEMIKKIMTE